MRLHELIVRVKLIGKGENEEVGEQHEGQLEVECQDGEVDEDGYEATDVGFVDALDEVAA